MPQYQPYKDVLAAELQLQDRSPVQTPCPSRAGTPSGESHDGQTKEDLVVVAGWDRSPTQTPFHTRVGSKHGAELRPHTKEQAEATMKALNALVSVSDASDHASVDAPDDDSLLAEQAGIFKSLIITPDGSLSDRADSADLSAPYDDIRAIMKYGPKKPMVPVNVRDRSLKVPTSSKVGYVVVYLGANIGLTLCNKIVMDMSTFPYLLLSAQGFASMIGTTILLKHRYFQLQLLTSNDRTTLLLFSMLYTANTGIKKMTLTLVSGPFHQATGALVPFLIVAIYRYHFKNTISAATKATLIPLAIGLALTTADGSYPARSGICATLLSAALSATTTIATNRLQTTGKRLGPLELLHNTMPLIAYQALFLAFMTGELTNPVFWHASVGLGSLLALVCYAVLAAAVTAVGVVANKKAGALNVAVADNFKAVADVVIGVVNFGVGIGWAGTCGILLSGMGALAYGMAAGVEGSVTGEGFWTMM